MSEAVTTVRQAVRDALIPRRGAEAMDIIWSRELFPKFGPLAGPIKAEYKRHKRRGRRQANEWLREVTEFHEAAPIAIRKIKDLQGIEEGARKLARQCVGDIGRVRVLLESQSFELPNGTSDESILARAADWQYWRRVLRRKVCRYRDQLMRMGGYVHKHRMIYCADQTVEFQAGRQRSNLDMMKKIIMTSDQEPATEVSLAEIVERSMANPEMRRNEIMVRIHGMEEFAEMDPRDVQAVFITQTCPSAYHARHAATGAPNLRYNKATPREANAYLQRVWSRIRSKFKRAGVILYGFRITEPHHDGTPHLHFLLFVARKDRRRLLRIFKHYALAEDGNEKGAKQHRLKYEWIDKAQGSATGYIIKYIAKNIDGHGVGEDLFGNPAEMASNRIVATMRTWGIRQFQQIGSASVTVWREYRRIREAAEINYQHKAPWTCASAPEDEKADWCGFMQCMGGAAPGRAQPTQIARGVRVSLATGECSPALNRYGEKLEGSKRPIIGLIRDNDLIETHKVMWSRKWSEESNIDWSLEARRKARNTGEAVPETAGFPAWTRDNNCTRGPPMSEKLVAGIGDDIEIFRKRAQSVIDQVPEENKKAVRAILRDSAEWMEMALEVMSEE